MNIKIVKFFAIVCAVLSVILISEGIIAKFAENRLLNSDDSSRKRKQPILSEIPAINLKATAEENYADLVNRPLFIKGRRPVEEESPEQTDLKAGSDTFDWQLNGVYTTDQGMSALFSRTRAGKDVKDKFQRLKEDEYLDDWKLTEIHKDNVILKRDGESKELLLSKPKPKELPKTPAQAKKPAGRGNDKQKKQRPARPSFLRKDKNQKIDTPSKSTEDSSENSK